MFTSHAAYRTAATPDQLTCGTRVAVAERGLEGHSFTGTIERINAPGPCRPVRFVVRRDEPVTINGFARPIYFAGADELTLLDPLPGLTSEQERFEAQR